MHVFANKASTNVNTVQQFSSCWHGWPFWHNRHGPKSGGGDSSQSWCANRWADVLWQPVYSSCAKACYYHLRRIRQIRKYVDDEAIRSLVHAFVPSRSRLTTTVTVSMPLQCVYSSEAPTCTKLCSTSIVADAPRRGSSRPLLQQLHWLPG